MKFRRSTIASAVIGLCILSFVLWLLTPGEPPTTAVGGSFKLTDGSGQDVTDRDYRGKFMLVYFGYTHCPDICPTTLETIARALPLMGKEADLIQPLFITIDPIRDTPPVIGRYVALFSPRIAGLSGSASQLEHVEQAYHVYVGPEDPKTGTIDHGALLYVMGRNGEFLSSLEDDISSASLAAALSNVVSKNSS